MKTAFSFWQGRIAPVFDVARQVWIVESKEGRIVSQTQETLPGEVSLDKASRLVEMGVETLICGAISRYLQGAIRAAGILVIPFVSGSIEEIMEAWGKGRISDASFAMPGCWGNPRGRRRGAFPVSPPGAAMEKSGDSAVGRSRGGPGRRGGPGGFPGLAGRGNCLCPKCGYLKPHEPGTPCVSTQCPRCGSVMTRQ